MSKIFLIVSAVLLLGTVGLNVLTRSKLTAKTEALNTAQRNATTAQSEAAKAKSETKTAEAKATEAASKATELQGQLDVANAEKNKVDEQIKTATNRVQELDNEITRLKGQPPAHPDLAPTVNPAIEEELTKAKQERDELKVVREGLENKMKSLEGLVANYKADADRRAINALKPGLRGSILAVDRNWNFVILSLGNRSGVVNNAQMIVQRGGSMVGKVRITSVEPTQSIADIVPNSVPPGVEVRQGDTVIFPGGS